MADGHIQPLHAFTNPLSSHFSSTSAIANGHFLNTLLNHFTAEPRSSSKSPAPGSQGHTSRGMYTHNQQQGPNSRLNGAPGRQQGMPMMYNYQQQGGHPQQHHAQHHPTIQPDHSGHGAGTGMMGASTFTSGVMPNSSPFSSNALQNGHVTTTRGGQAQAVKEHWAEQLRLRKEAERAHVAMTEQHQPHYYARIKAPENRGIGVSASTPGGSASTADGEGNRRRPYNVDKSEERQDWHNLDMSGQGLRVLSPTLFSYEFLVELYIASNRLSHLPADLGRLRHLKLLEASNNLISELPPEIGMCTELKQLFLFDNQLQDLPHEVGALTNLEMIGIEGNPHFNPRLKEEVIERGTKSLVSMLLEEAPVPMPPAPRKFVPVQEDLAPSLERVKVLTWNILCEKFATPAMYGYTPSGALSWEYRQDRILQEIRERDADILCLQEIATDVFTEHFSPELAQADYKGIHWPRAKAKMIGGKEAQHVDGCAIFYKSSKYILLDKQLLDYANIAINRPDMKNHHDVFNRVMPKDNIGVVAFFESRATGARMIVVNTHLCWEPIYADVKLYQTALLVENLTKLAEKYSRWPALKEKDKRMIQMPVEEGQEAPKLPEPVPSQEYRSNTEIPLLVCGDYNSTPDSSVYELLSKGRVSPSHSEFGKYQYGNFTRDGVDHPFNLRSAYVHLDGTPDELPFTNYVPGFKEVIDYIFYSTNTLEVVELLGPPDREHLKRVPGFPNYHFPADHIQIMAEFVIKARKDKKMITEPDFGSSSNDRRG